MNRGSEQRETNLPELSYSSQGFILTLAEDGLKDTQTEMNDRLISVPNLTANHWRKNIRKISLELWGNYTHLFYCIGWMWNYLSFLFIPLYGSVGCYQLREGKQKERISRVIMINFFTKQSGSIPNLEFCDHPDQKHLNNRDPIYTFDKLISWTSSQSRLVSIIHQSSWGQYVKQDVDGKKYELFTLFYCIVLKCNS